MLAFQVQLTDDVLRFRSELTERDIMAAYCCGQVSTGASDLHDIERILCSAAVMACASQQVC